MEITTQAQNNERRGKLVEWNDQVRSNERLERGMRKLQLTSDNGKCTKDQRATVLLRKNTSEKHDEIQGVGGGGALNLCGGKGEMKRERRCGEKRGNKKERSGMSWRNWPHR